MPISISISGKGGSGKTTLTALFLKYLIENTNNTILVVDADPAINMPDVLGVKIERTVGDVVNEFKKRLEKETLFSKPEMLELLVQETLIEAEKFDLLVMGRTEGKGCYCYVNAVLRKILDSLAKNYDIVLMDMEAGLEHLSRRVDANVDYLVITVDPSKMGFSTARKLIEMVRSSEDVAIKKIYIVGNLFKDEEMIRKFCEELNVSYGGVVPYDENIQKYNLEGKSLLELPTESPAVVAAKRIVKRILEL